MVLVVCIRQLNVVIRQDLLPVLAVEPFGIDERSIVIKKNGLQLDRPCMSAGKESGERPSNEIVYISGHGRGAK